MLPRKELLVTGECCRCREFQPAPRALRARRGWDLALGTLSLGVWVFMPKCPVCLAAYAALWTGLGLSLTEATYLRGSLLVLSGMLLSFLALKRALHALRGLLMRWRS